MSDDKRPRAKPRRGKSEGSIWQLKNGTWRASVSGGTDPATGKRVRLTATHRTKAEAVGWVAEQNAKRAGGQLRANSLLTVGAWVDDWLEKKRGTIQPATQLTYGQAVARCVGPFLGDCRLDRLDEAAVESWFSRMRAANVPTITQRKAAEALNQALVKAVRRGLLTTNPLAQVKRPRHDAKEIVPYDEAQVAALMASLAGRPEHVWFALALDAGMRPGELFGLTWANVDTAGRLVRVRQSLEYLRNVPTRLKAPKTRRGRRDIRVAPQTAALLAGHREAQLRDGVPNPLGLVFTAPGGGYVWRANFVERIFKPALRRAGLPDRRIYDLRHTCATLLLARRIDVRTVSERLGHESVAITLKHYAHVLPAQEEAAVAEIAAVLYPGPA